MTIMRRARGLRRTRTSSIRPSIFSSSWRAEEAGFFLNKVLNNKSGLPVARRSVIFVPRIASSLKDISPVMIRDEQVARMMGAGALVLILGAL
ncbi:MAG TPA: hypothetical protein VNY75_04555, partial [Rhizomicrobium sp.]|nr:hypothetical protein [Rhizomicrobium sp.]